MDIIIYTFRLLPVLHQHAGSRSITSAFNWAPDNNPENQMPNIICKNQINVKIKHSNQNTCCNVNSKSINNNNPENQNLPIPSLSEAHMYTIKSKIEKTPTYNLRHYQSGGSHPLQSPPPSYGPKTPLVPSSANRYQVLERITARE